MISVILQSYILTCSVWILAYRTASLQVEQHVGKEHLISPDRKQIYLIFTSNWLIVDKELQLNESF